MSQLFIVTTPQNSGLGTPLATAFNYTNSNFSELYARYQVNVPGTLLGQEGDVAGMYASDENYFYYCFADYDGSSAIWAQVTQVGNITVPRIVNGTSNVDILAPNSNVTVGVNGLGNVVSIANTGVYVQGIVSAIGNISGSYILGNGSLLTGLPATYSDANVATLLSSFGANNISTTGNITAGNFLGDGSQLVNITAANINGVVANATLAVSATTANTVTVNAQPNITSVGTLSSVTVSGNVNGGNLQTNGTVSASGNIVTAGFFVGNFSGNIVGTLTNIPGPGGAVVFNDGTGNAAATAGLVFDNSGPNVLTVLGNVSATANVVANVIVGNLLSGILITSAQPNVTSLGTLTGLSVTGNVTGGNLLTGGNISAIGRIEASSVTGTIVSATGSVSTPSTIGGVITGTSLSVTGNVTGTSLFGTIGTATQNNITSVGTLSSLTVSANIQGGNLRTTGLVSATGNINAAGNIRGGNLTTVTDIAAGGNVSASNFQGVSVSVVGNVTGNAILSAGIISAAGNATVGNITTTGLISTSSNISGGNLLTGGNVNAGGDVNAGGNVTGNNLSATGFVSASGNITSPANIIGGVFSGTSLSVSGNITGSSLIGAVATASQPAITEIGTLTNLGVTANIVAGNVNSAGQFSTTGNITGANIVASNVFGTISTASQPNITSVGTLSSLSVSGNIQSGNLSVSTGLITAGGIINANSNAVGNIGSSTGYFNTVFAKATSAQYADLAENYVSDADYDPGTVVIFGGGEEITISLESADERVAGVISANPAHLMNAGSDGLAVALRGRVPVRVVGPVIKGDSLVTSNLPGTAKSIGRSREYAQAVFAKALETDLNNGEKIITAVIL
jgi:hypothetical protein